MQPDDAHDEEHCRNTVMSRGVLVNFNSYTTAAYKHRWCAARHVQVPKIAPDHHMPSLARS
jgi:hypothetical protein